MKLRKGIISQVEDDGEFQTAEIIGLDQEQTKGVRRYQSYGFASYPLPINGDGVGCEVVFNAELGQKTVFGDNDPRYRPTLTDGQVVVYSHVDNSDHRIELLPDSKQINIISGVSSFKQDDAGNLTQTNGVATHRLNQAAITSQVGASTQTLTAASVDVVSNAISHSAQTMTLTGAGALTLLGQAATIASDKTLITGETHIPNGNISGGSSVGGSVAADGSVSGGVTIDSLLQAVDENSDIGGSALEKLNNANPLQAPYFPSGAIAISHVLNDDGSCNLTLRWNYDGDNFDIDGFIILSKAQVDETPFFDLTTQLSDNDPLLVADPTARKYTYYGAPVNVWYFVGIRAFRRVNNTVEPSGVLLSPVFQIVEQGYAPYRPADKPVVNARILEQSLIGATATEVGNVVDWSNTAFVGTANYRQTGAPNGSFSNLAVNATENNNGSLDIRLSWNFSQGSIKADRIILYTRPGTSNPNTSSAATSMDVKTGASEYIFYGVPKTDYRAGLVMAKVAESGLKQSGFSYFPAYNSSDATTNIQDVNISGSVFIDGQSATADGSAAAQFNSSYTADFGILSQGKKAGVRGFSDTAGGSGVIGVQTSFSSTGYAGHFTASQGTGIYAITGGGFEPAAHFVSQVTALRLDGRLEMHGNIKLHAGIIADGQAISGTPVFSNGFATSSTSQVNNLNAHRVGGYYASRLWRGESGQNGGTMRVYPPTVRNGKNVIPLRINGSTAYMVFEP